MQRRLLHVIAMLSVIALAGSPVATAASPNGLAWDSVTKLEQTTDPSSVQPGSFDSDYAAAAAIQASTDIGGGGFMAKMKAAEQMAKDAQAIAEKGLAEKHYVAGSKERTDVVAYGTATIRDCNARTITTLNLRKKTYKVESMDKPSQPSAPSSGRPQPAPAPTDDGSRLAFDVRNTALGAKQVGGQPTQGYRSDIKMTATKPSGERQVSNVNMVAYYSNFDQPVVLCTGFFGIPRPPTGTSPQQQSMMMMGAYRNFLSMMAHPLSGRVSVTQTGPALQYGKLAMFDATSFGGGRQGGSFVGERGNVRHISDNDPAFSVPSDFTKEQ